MEDRREPDAHDPRAPSLDHRVSGRAVVAWLRTDADEPWWIEEELVALPNRAGDREIGPRSLVRMRPGSTPVTVFRATGDERLLSAVSHPSRAWTAALVDARGAVSLVRGNADGSIVARVAADDPMFAADRLAWFEGGGGPPTHTPVAPGRAEDSVRLAASGEDVLLTLTTYWGSALAYRWRFVDGAFVRGPRTLLAPANPLPVFIPDTASYDVFDAVTNPWSTHACVAPDGRAYVAIWVDHSRLQVLNAAWGTRLSLVRRDLTIVERPSDILVTRVERDGARSLQLVVGTADVDDEPFAIACAADGRVAVAGRHRREPGRDNTEIHGFAAVIDGDRGTFVPRTFDGQQLALFQTAAFDARGALWLGGTEDWVQNPVGVSVGGQGRPFVVRWDAREPGEPERVTVAATRGHSEVRAIAVTGANDAALWLAGIEDGPVTHTFDGNRAALRGDGWVSIRPVQPRQ